MANLIKIDDNDFLVKDYLRQEEINENTLLLNYKTLLKRYLSQGEPSEDTLRSYCSAIDSYIKWCLTNKVHPLKITEYQFMYYRDFLIKMNMKKGSIKVKLNAIKQFYNIAVKLKLIENSPAKDVGVKIHEASEISPMKFLTLEQLRDLLNIIPDYDEKHIEYLRDKIIIMLMALEGLRTVEVHRMSVNDINWEMKTIYIHGKGHNDFIYPRDDVLILLQEYLKRDKDGKKFLFYRNIIGRIFCFRKPEVWFEKVDRVITSTRITDLVTSATGRKHYFGEIYERTYRYQK